MAATKLSLRSVARRYQHLCEEIHELDEQLEIGWWPKPPRVDGR
jgi:hypothetical protein